MSCALVSPQGRPTVLPVVETEIPIIDISSESFKAAEQKHEISPPTPQTQATRAGGPGINHQKLSALKRRYSTIKRQSLGHLSWEKMSFSVGKKEKTAKMILKNVWGAAPRNNLCAILGPSGSGKTSLLNILAGRSSSRPQVHISGAVYLDQQKINPLKFRNRISYVMQEDNLFAMLTVRETVRFSAEMRLTPQLLEDIEHQIDQLLEELGLLHCQHTLMGSSLKKGVSGGEKKRTAICVELVTRPAIIFLDEPTSGLDSYAAYECIRLLKDMAANGATVVCTIHQPASAVFSLFDRTMLLRAGRTVFSGKTLDMGKHFASAGNPVPSNFNPADHVLHVVMTTDDAAAERLLMAPPHADDSTAVRAEDLSALAIPPAAPRVSACKQLLWLLWREVRGTTRDYGYLIGRFGITGFLFTLYGVIFRHAGGRDDSIPENFNTHWNSITFLCISGMFLQAQPVLLQFPSERPIVLRETSGAMYSVPVYFFSKLLLELPLGVFQCIVATIPPYFLMELDGNFFAIMIGIYLLGLVASSVAILMGSVLADVKTAIEMAPLVFIPQILFAGVFVAMHQIPSFMRWVQYLCALKYAVNLFTIVEFHGCHFETCQTRFDDNDIDRDGWWTYAGLLIALAIGFRSVALFFLWKRSKAVF